MALTPQILTPLSILRLLRSRLVLLRILYRWCRFAQPTGYSLSTLQVEGRGGGIESGGRSGAREDLVHCKGLPGGANTLRSRVHGRRSVRLHFLSKVKTLSYNLLKPHASCSGNLAIIRLCGNGLRSKARPWSMLRKPSFA
jgi:hypothetical protein